jgi:signal transduction histidine kinase/CheY-like chemotaxis protein
MVSISSYFKDNPIAARLLGLIILSSSVITLIAILFQLYTSYHDDVGSLEKRLDQVRNSSLASITKSLWGFDQEQLDIQIESLLDVDDVIQVQVNWQDWNNTAQIRSASTGRYSADDIEKKPGRFLVRQYPLIYEDSSTTPQVLGSLVITASLASIYDKLRERAIFIAAVQTAKTLLISFFILWLVYTLLTRHMKSIAWYARQLHLQNLDTPLKLRRMKIDPTSDELDNVVDAINHMRETLLEDIEQRQTMELALRSEKQERLETRRQQQAAEESSRAKSQFLATMSHEIRTPMNGVIGMLEMLRNTPLNEQQQHYVDVIYRSGENLLTIINDILDYSKIEAGKLQLEEVEFNLEELLRDCLQLFGATASKQKLDFFGGLWPTTPIYLKGDPTRLRQIIINLLGNAFKFTRQGFISLQAKPLRQTGDDVVLEFLIADSGIGIDAKAMETIFESFHQADASTTRKYGGTGLGLAICKSLSALMEGDITVTSTPENGSTFRLTARFHKNTCAGPMANNAVPVNGLAGKHLLVLDTHPPLQHFFQEHARLRHIHLQQATDIAQALTHLTDTTVTPNCIVIQDSFCADEEIVEALEIILQRSPGIILMLLSDHNNELTPRAATLFHRQLRKPLFFSTLEQAWYAMITPNPQPVAIHDPEDVSVPAAMRVLVAEDNTVNRMVITGLLQKLNIQPQVVHNGLQALEAVQAAVQPFDLILMDCEMPEMDGFDATRHIRLHEQQQGLQAQPIMALTAHAMAEHRDAIFGCGMDDCLSKPVTLQALRSAIQRIHPGRRQAP